MEPIPYRVNGYITQGGQSYCDGCIQKALELSRSQQVQQVTSALETTSDFIREAGVCALCKEPKQVIRHT
jgi:hypothetical protein